MTKTVEPLSYSLGDLETPPEVYQERARRLAAMLDARPERLEMSSWTRPESKNECGTTACVAGWAVIWSRGAVDIGPDGTMTWSKDADLWCTYPHHSYERDGAQFLGLTDTGATALFFGADEETAVDVLRQLGSGELEPTDVANAVFA